MIGYRHVRVAVVHADEAVPAAQTQLHEARVADHDPLQPIELGKAQRTGCGLRNRLAPACRACPRRPLALDRKRGFGIVEQQEGRRTCQQIRTDAPDRVAGPDVESAVAIGVQHRCPAHHRTECRRSRQVVDHAMPGGRLTFGERKLQIGIDDRHRTHPSGVGKIEPRPGEPLVEKPDSARISACRTRRDDRGDLRAIDDAEEARENRQIEPLIA
jgi:hypothetical protein